VSDERLNTVQPKGERQFHESVPVASGEQGTSPQQDGPGTSDPADNAVVTEDGGWEWKGLEVQFHTPESWEAKQMTHDAYAMIENPDSSDADKAAARRYQQEVSAAVPVPEGADEIPPYTDVRH
jgi:hypothetical protein